VFRDPASILEVILAESVSAISEAEHCILIIEIADFTNLTTLLVLLGC
jgi:hypothetical protein